MRRIMLVILVAASSTASAPVLAHSGGLNAEGCHNDRKNGGYHCHRAPSGSAVPRPETYTPQNNLTDGVSPANSGDAFRNCSAARAAGAAPVRRGDPGYGSHLDRDGDGVGCE